VLRSAYCVSSIKYPFIHTCYSRYPCRGAVILVCNILHKDIANSVPTCFSLSFFVDFTPSWLILLFTSTFPCGINLLFISFCVLESWWLKKICVNPRNLRLMFFYTLPAVRYSFSCLFAANCSLYIGSCTVPVGLCFEHFCYSQQLIFAECRCENLQTYR